MNLNNNSILFFDFFYCLMNIIIINLFIILKIKIKISYFYNFILIKFNII